MKISSMIAVGLAALVGLSLTFDRASAGGGGDETRLRARLAGNAFNALVPSGSAEYRARADGVRLRIQVEDVNLPAGTRVVATVNAAGVGEITLSGLPLNAGELELNSKDGAVVPSVGAGAMVAIFAPGTTTPVLTGVLK